MDAKSALATNLPVRPAMVSTIVMRDAPASMWLCGTVMPDSELPAVGLFAVQPSLTAELIATARTGFLRQMPL